MTDLAREIGALGARMDAHESNNKRIEGKLDKHIFESAAWRTEIGGKIDALMAIENQRKGADRANSKIWSVVKFVIGSSAAGSIAAWAASRWSHQ